MVSTTDTRRFPATSVSSSSTSQSDSYNERRKRRSKSRHPREGALSGMMGPGGYLPVLVDQRFEQSYIASIRGFVHELEKQEAKEEKRAALEEKEKEATTPFS